MHAGPPEPLQYSSEVQQPCDRRRPPTPHNDPLTSSPDHNDLGAESSGRRGRGFRPATS